MSNPALAAQITALRDAIASGAMRIKYRGASGEEKDVTYRSLAEMRDVLADLERQAGVRSRVRSSYASHSRGYN